MSRTARSRSQRTLTALFAVCFALLGVIAPAFHTHRMPGRLGIATHATTASTQHASPATAVISGLETCLLCDWLMTAGQTPPSIPVVLTLAFSTAAVLLISVRAIALCQRALPQRGLRAPPTTVFLLS